MYKGPISIIDTCISDNWYMSVIGTLRYNAELSLVAILIVCLCSD